MKQELRLGAIVEQGVAGVAETDATGRFTRVNARYREILGYSEAELLGLRMHDITHVDDLPHNLELFDALVGGGPPFTIEKRYRRKDGTTVWVNNSVSAMRDGEGALQGLVALTLDIEEHKRAQALLVEQAQWLERIATGRPLAECLLALTESVSRLHPPVRAAVLLADPARGAIASVHSAHLPASFGAAIIGTPIGALPGGTCGAAMHLGVPVASADVACDAARSPRWRELCSAHGIRAARSTPAFAPDGKAVASFALFFAEPRDADAWELRLAGFGAHLASLVIERDRAAQALRDSRAELEAELADTRLLHAISAQLMQDDDADALYATILDAAASIMRSQCASMQMLDPHVPGDLHLLAARGFSAEATRFWQRVSADSRSTCGIALAKAQRVVEPDVEHSAAMAASADQAMYLQAGIRAVQTTPLVSRTGGVLGMISTHWSEPHTPSERDLRLLDILARQAADLLERRQHGEALRESEQRFRTVVNDSATMIWNAGADGAIVREVPAWGAYTGQSFAEYSGYGWLAAIHPDEYDATLAEWSTGQAERRPVHATYRLRSASGAYRWVDVHGSPIPNPDGSTAEWVGTITDIHDRREAEARLSESERRFRALIEVSPQFVWTARVDGSVDYHNPHWYAYRGLAPGADDDWVDAVHPDLRAPLAARWQHCMASGEEWHEEVLLRGGDGQYRWFQSQGLPLRDEQGAITGWMGIGIDIHERKLAAEALREADRRKDEFLATLAHELRNPLAPIRNALHLLRVGGARVSTERVHEMLDRQVNHMVRLIDDLMEVSRITRGTIELKRERLDLRTVVQNAVETSRPLIEHAQHQLSVVLPGDPLPVHGDPVRLAQVLANLLNNAARYTDAGGRIEISARKDGERALVAVRDSGIGIAADKLPALFEMFAQIDRGDARSQGGLGIGLSLAQRLAQMHGGGIEAASEGLGCGAKFTVRLPLAASLR